MATGAADAAQNTLLERVARVGQATSGVVHALIGYIVVRLAFGESGAADQSGALATMAAAPGGTAVLWVTAVTLAALAVWRLTEAVMGKRCDVEDPSTLDRLKSAGVAVAYAALAFTALQFALGNGKSSGEQSAGLSARLMQSGAGKTVLVVAGLVAVGIGAYHVYKGVSRKFLDDLHRPVPGVATVLGVVGYTAKGLAIAGAGILVVVATVTSDPAKATGLDGALKTLGTAPFGQVLLCAAGLGIVTYGAYCFVLARYGRM
ncbi:DUF1206 domain-containing protein [Rhodococcus zopfii]